MTRFTRHLTYMRIHIEKIYETKFSRPDQYEITQPYKHQRPLNTLFTDLCKHEYE